jgi:glutaredoxin-like protein NrdH
MSFKEYVKHVNGTKKGDITLYALSTCGWCRKTKGLLNELKVDYNYVDTDLLEGSDREEAIDEVRKWNPACSFPTMVINNKTCIVGFKEDEIRETLGHASK